MTNKEVADYLSACSPADLADIITNSIYKRPAEVHNGIEQRVVLCTAWRTLQPLGPCRRRSGLGRRLAI